MPSAYSNVHRDVKPATAMVSAAWHAGPADFGAGEEFEKRLWRGR